MNISFYLLLALQGVVFATPVAEQHALDRHRQPAPKPPAHYAAPPAYGQPKPKPTTTPRPKPTQKSTYKPRPKPTLQYPKPCRTEYVTSTKYSTGVTRTLTKTIAPRPGTVIIVVPRYPPDTTTDDQPDTSTFQPSDTDTNQSFITLPGIPGSSATSSWQSSILDGTFVTATSFDPSISQPTTTIIPPSNGQPGTVFVRVPVPFVTSTNYDPLITSPSTSTQYSSGQPAGTVIIVDRAIYTTSTVYRTDIAAPATRTATTFQPGPPLTTGVVEVESLTAPATRTATTFQPGLPVTTGVVEVDSPVQLSPTTSFGDFTAPATTTLYQSGSSTGTVIVQYPAPFITSTVYSNVLAAFTTTAVPNQGATPGTVTVGIPIVYVTTTTTGNFPQATATTVYDVGSPSGTIIQQEPAPTTPLPPPVACANQGLESAEYDTPEVAYGTGYPEFDPTALKLSPPNYQGVTDSIGGYFFPLDTQGTLTIYDGIVIPSDYFALNHQGYIFPTVSGPYTFTSTGADDVTLVWLGLLAYPGWTRANANLEQAFASPTRPANVPQSFTVTLTAGVYYPLRIIRANGGGQTRLALTAIGPDGTEFLGPNTASSPLLVRYSCNLVTAPRLPLFGVQTK